MTAERKEMQQLLFDQAVRLGVQQQIRTVIKAGALTVQHLQPANDQLSGMRENQLRNVVNVAIRAKHVEEVAAFILYQLGRSTNSRQWQYGNFGDEVVKDLMTGEVRDAATAAKSMAMEIMAKGEQRDMLNADAQQELFDSAYIALARQYLGYLNRMFYFADRTGRWKELDQMTKGGTI
ncbi:MAG: hypothetical protein H0X37_23350 [Herpetosiphonaceae bacterium]|nr:hypothetical protein [Herpetosiphonaceae bacterium]